MSRSPRAIAPSSEATKPAVPASRPLLSLALGEGAYRFNALRRRVSGVSEKMLSQTLQALERDGIVHREVVTTIPPRVEYTLTPLGVEVAARMRDLTELLESAVPQIAAAREAHSASAKSNM